MKKRIVLCLAMAGIFPAVQAQTVVIDSQVTLAEALGLRLRKRYWIVWRLPMLSIIRSTGNSTGDKS
ncbi:hypothetical protein [Alistipes indistinctus]|uniref:hypothetical protein n=1 Tax=Alistipes indistinctus TaxID=626932 RepID=UPI0015FB39C9|nr:hypothetical protein [Alistipes indistinctus]